MVMSQAYDLCSVFFLASGCIKDVGVKRGHITSNVGFLNFNKLEMHWISCAKPIFFFY